MKKLRNFFSSMTFGMILMGLILACSVAGSLIAQNEGHMWYYETYGEIYTLILMLGIDDVFHGWFFITLMALLCINLSLCSLVRIKRVVAASRTAVDSAAGLPTIIKLTAEGVKKLREYLEVQRYKRTEREGVTVYHKNAVGRYGSFITHLSILMVVIFGALALYLPVISDIPCLPGESIVMDDGTDIAVKSFHIENSEGELDYASIINVTLPNGRQSGETEISVNYPMSFGRYKIYQQTYGTAGAINVKNLDTGIDENMTLTDSCFLSVDGVNGLWYEVLYAGYTRDEEGNFTLISSTSGSYPDPVYQVLTAVDGEYTPVLAFPGESLTVGNIQFTMLPPVEYPGLRIKTEPQAANALLLASFVLMIIGLWLCFFQPPVLITVREDGYTVSGTKPEGIRLELDMLLEKERIDEDA